MKKFALLLAFPVVLGVCIAHSQTYYMNVRMKGGTTTSIPLQDIQKITFSGISAVGNQSVENVIRIFTLLQNYPNPFNPSTTIEFQIPKAGNVEIRIINIAGQLVRTIENKFVAAGTHRVVWDGKTAGGQAVASGPYICQVSFENSVLTKKLLLIK